MTNILFLLCNYDSPAICILTHFYFISWDISDAVTAAAVDDGQAVTASLKSDSNSSHQQHAHRLTQESVTSSSRPSASIILNNSTSTASLQQVHTGASCTTSEVLYFMILL